MVLYMRNGGSGKVTSLLSLRGYETHYSNVIMGAMASQITSLTIVYSTVHSGADQRKHQSSASLAFVRRIHRWPVNSPHKWPVTRKCFHLMTSSCLIKLGFCQQQSKYHQTTFYHFAERTTAEYWVLVGFYIRSYPSNVSFCFIKIIWH